jgi:hypothetical protein
VLVLVPRADGTILLLGTSSADRANKFAIARGEAMECGAILGVVGLLDAISSTEIDAAKGSRC